jgi:hypothetical protein
MSSISKQGITPLLLRTAARYAALGVGEYETRDYAGFNKVKVAIILPWKPNLDRITDSCLVLRVDFFDGDISRRYVEFRLALDGFGGEDILKLVSDNNVDPILPVDS